jgi:UDP-perosamine 4-acetyltransferase
MSYSKKIIIIGAGGQCRSVISIIQDIGNWDIFGIIDINYKGAEEVIMGKPVIGGIDMIDKQRIQNYSLVLAIGDNIQRERISLSLPDGGFEYPNLIHPLSFVDKTAKLGRGNVIGCFSFVGPKVEIGDYNIVNTGSILEHETTIGNFNHIAPMATVCGRVDISDKVLLGASSVVIPKIKINSGVTIGANSTLIHDVIKQNLTFIGNPAIEK